MQTTIPITFTPAALAHFHKQVAKQPAATIIRITLKTAGCSGLQYQLACVEQPQPDDVIYLLDDTLRVSIDAKSIPFIDGTVVDYVKEGLNGRLKFMNPKEKGSCGCGESFYV